MTKIEAGPFENGAVILRGADARGRVRFEIHYGEGGAPIRMMRDRTEAIAFAEALPVPDLPPVVPPSQVNLSPRTHPSLRKERGLDPQPVPEPADASPALFKNKSMSAHRERSGLGPSDRTVGVAARPRERT